VVTLTVGLVSVGHASCQRNAELRDELIAPFKPPPSPPLDAHFVDTGLGTDAFPACATRPIGPCTGPTDYPCGFATWANVLAKFCFRKTGCKTDGKLEITMGKEGCVIAVAMSHPDDDMVRCVLEEVGSVRCSCDTQTLATYFFGLGNSGCLPCSQEFPCPERMICEDGQCVPERSGDAGP
jgi:hypothetical protein